MRLGGISSSTSREEHTCSALERRCHFAAMSYDIHVVRTKDWLEASTNPVTKRDVDSLIAGDEELDWSVDEFVDG